MELRAATLADLSNLIALRLAYLLDDYGSLPQETVDAIRQALPAYFSKHLNQDMFEYIAEENRQIVATAILFVIEKPANPHFIRGKIGEVLSVYTHPNFRKQGLATRLMEMVLKKAKDLELDYVQLNATAAGRTLYEKLGFEKEESAYIPMKYTIGASFDK